MCCWGLQRLRKDKGGKIKEIFRARTISSFKDTVRGVDFILDLVGSHWGLTGRMGCQFRCIKGSLNAWDCGWGRAEGEELLSTVMFYVSKMKKTVA